MDWTLSRVSCHLPPKRGTRLVRASWSNFYSISVPKEKLKKWLFWNGSLGLLHSQAPPLMIASMINITDLNFETPFRFASSILSILSLVVLALATCIEIYVIHAHKGVYQLEEF